MAMKKQERKDGYTKALSLIIEGKHKEAFNSLTEMCGKDTGLYLLINYDEAVEQISRKNGEVAHD